ncbi:MAG: hypothetical protein QME58_02155 [Bacteroidota bacterium]|nr:hypothetical protein [Bacteroidota bacterium]
MRLKLYNEIIFFTIIIILCPNTMFTQYMSSSRGVGVAAFTALSADVSSIDWNPGGLTNIREWELNFSNFKSTSIAKSGFTFQSFGIGKKFFEKHAAAIRYSPGSNLEFIVPAAFSVYDTAGNIIVTKFDKRISFSQNYSVGYAYNIVDELSFGFSARLFDSKVSDTKYFIDTNNVIQSLVSDYSASSWAIDFGTQYKINNKWYFGLVFKNLFKISEVEFTEALRNYQLNLAKSVCFGLAYSLSEKFITSFEFDTKNKLRFGAELSAFDFLQVRSGVYTTDFPKFSPEAASIGFSISYHPVQLSFSYLRFFDQTNRRGVSSIDILNKSGYADIDYTPFTTDRLSLSVSINLGRTKDVLARIEFVEMLSEVFPASYQTYAFRPLGIARVRNVSSKPIEAKVSFFVDDFMNAPTETKPFRINSNETIEVPFLAVFNSAINAVKKFSIYDGTVYVHAEPAGDYDDRYQTRVLIRGKNDWNGDVMLLRYFITPNDPDIIKFSRKVLDKKKSENDNGLLLKFKHAAILFDELARHVQYISDPKQSADFVQYPAETISLRGGDCDDLTVCYAALLGSIGISSALVDVIPADDPKNSHIYLMLDTEIEVSKANLISDNTKRYIIRKNEKGIETVWLPVETTILSKGFSEAWNTGASNYFQDVIINNGIGKGWVRVVDLPSSF